ncbi:MAG: hypothetical protein R2734_14170 [Nocardioides sp.]
MTTVTIIGAGSTVFAAELVTDFLLTPGLPEGEFRLVDLDATRLELAHRFAEHLVASAGRSWTVRSSTDRTELLAGSDVVISTIEVAGLATRRPRLRDPLKYGVDSASATPSVQAASSRRSAPSRRCSRSWPMWSGSAPTRWCSAHQPDVDDRAGRGTREAPSRSGGCATRCTTPSSSARSTPVGSRVRSPSAPPGSTIWPG